MTRTREVSRAPSWLTEAEWRRVGEAIRFTERQERVLSAVLEGDSDQQIANRLDIAAPTVRSHIRQLFGSAGVRDRTSLAVMAVRIAFGREDR